MELTSDSETLIRQYLLDNVTSDEQRRVEERLLTDDHYFNQLCAIEEDLIDEYVHDALPDGDLVRFERHFLNGPDRSESVAFARVLNACVSRRVGRPVTRPAASVSGTSATPHPAVRASGWRRVAAYLPTFSVLLIVLVTAILLIETRTLRRQIERSRTETAGLEQRKDDLQQQLMDQIARNESQALALEREQANVAKLTRELSTLEHSTVTTAPFLAVLFAAFT